MIAITNKKECMGCSACKEICPKKCIIMKEDEEGFLYPTVDEKQCVNCHLCEKICPIKNKKEKTRTTLEVYAAINKDKEVLKNSSSGGVFYALASKIIEQGGIVFGAAFDSDFEVKHVAVEKIEEIQKLQGSKYVQSDMHGQYAKAKEELEKGRSVLFSGAPCQISGLYHYLKKDYENLITCDFICTGVPSPKIFRLYKKQFEKKNNSMINIKFRDKKQGWMNFGMKFEYERGKKYLCRYFNPFILAHFSHLTLRPACYDCKFKYLDSGSDIKLADYWLVKSRYPKFYDFDGVSHILINTGKGKTLFDLVKDQFYLQASSYEDVVQDNLSFSEIVKEPKERKELFSLLAEGKEQEALSLLNQITKRSLKQKIHDTLFVNGSKIKYKLLKK